MKEAKIIKSLGFLIVLLLAPLGSSAAEVGMVTSVGGTVRWQAGKAAGASQGALQPFVKIRDGDRLTLVDSSAAVQIVYFNGGRQENWQGKGAILVGDAMSARVQGALEVDVRSLPPILVSQIARMPGPDGVVRAGMTRVRSLPGSAAVSAAEQNYSEMRQQANPGDRASALYLAAAYFELREFGRLEAFLESQQDASPGDPAWPALRDLFRRAIDKAKKAER